MINSGMGMAMTTYKTKFLIERKNSTIAKSLSGCGSERRRKKIATPVFWRPEGKTKLSRRIEEEKSGRRTTFDEDGNESFSVLSRDDREKNAKEKTGIRNQCADEERSHIDQLENVNICVDAEG